MGLVATSCGGGTSERDYDVAVRNAYLENCQYEGGDPSSCAASLQCIEERLTQEEFEYEENWVILRGELSDRMTDVLATCMGRATVQPPLTTKSNVADQGRIAFIGKRGEVWQVFLINPDGTEVEQLTDGSTSDMDPAWSPDGSQIVFDRKPSGTKEISKEIYLMNPDGSGVTQLTHNQFHDVSASWSPDGKQIAYASAPMGSWDLYVMNSDGTEVRQLTGGEPWDHRPTWSPDGSRIAFDRQEKPGDKDPSSLEIFVINVDGTGLTQLTDNNRIDIDPTWSPDGSRIAFAGSTDSSREIFVMNADGTGRTQLTTHPSFDASPVWSPDGKQIAFSSNRNSPEHAFELFVMNADGTGVMSLVQVGEPKSWTP